MNEEIIGLLQTYQRGLNEANPDLVTSVFTDDAAVIGESFPTATGIDAISALYADFFSKLDFNVQFEPLEVEQSDTIGYLRTRSHGTIAPKGQQSPDADNESNREIFIVKKIEGAWKFHRYIFNVNVEAAG